MEWWPCKKYKDHDNIYPNFMNYVLNVIDYHVNAHIECMLSLAPNQIIYIPLEMEKNKIADQKWVQTSMGWELTSIYAMGLSNLLHEVGLRYKHYPTTTTRISLILYTSKFTK